jgi:hypothetical protein
MNDVNYKSEMLHVINILHVAQTQSEMLHVINIIHIAQTQSEMLLITCNISD